MKLWMLGQMPQDPSGELAAEDWEGVLHIYGAWRHRLVPARRRRAHLAIELTGEAEPGPYREAFQTIVARIEEGQSLRAYLSKNSAVAYQRDDGLAHHRRRDRDLMLAEWGIHHLHLSNQALDGGFVQRTEHVLFAIFRPEDAYLLGVFAHPRHTNWAAKDILARALRNWPDAGLVDVSNCAVGLTQEYTDEERLELRNAGVNTAMMINGRVCLPVGQVADGTPMVVSRHVMKVRASIDQWRWPQNDLAAELTQHAAAAADASAGPGDWEPHVTENAYGLRKNGLIVRFGSLTWPGIG